MNTDLHVLILQHPQEPDKLLGSARIAHLALENSTLKIGLSWPNLSKALGRQTIHSNWGVLFLGGRPAGGKAPHAPKNKFELSNRIQISTKTGKTFSPDEAALEGIVVLDGTWAQAKTMWWRNPWLLKLKRVILTPPKPSLYGNLRKEPRRECLSTIESIAEALEALGENPEKADELRRYFGELLKHYRQAHAKPNQGLQDSKGA